VTYALQQPISIAGKTRPTFGVKHFGYDPGLAPAGKSVVEVMYPSNYAYWKNRVSDPKRYESEKVDERRLDEEVPARVGKFLRGRSVG
jgi:hypothetical protein